MLAVIDNANWRRSEVILVEVRLFIFGLQEVTRARADLLADDALGLHGSWQAAAAVDEGHADPQRFLGGGLAGALGQGQRPDRRGGADVAAEGTELLAVADPRNQDRAPQPLDTRLGEGRLQAAVYRLRSQRSRWEAL